MESEKVHEPFTNEQARIEASAKEAIKKYKNIDKNTEEKLEKELSDLGKKYQELFSNLHNNPDFLEELKQLAKQYADRPTSPEYMEAYEALRNKFSPELIALEEKMATFNGRNNLAVPDLSPQQQKAMEADFAAHFKKHRDSQQLFVQLMDNPEYLHEAQLLAEKYNFNKDSADYLSATNELICKYAPELREMTEDMKAITAKYANYDNKSS